MEILGFTNFRGVRPSAVDVMERVKSRVLCYLLCSSAVSGLTAVVVTLGSFSKDDGNGN